MDNLIEENDLCLGTSTVNQPKDGNSIGTMETKGNFSQQIGHSRGVDSHKPLNNEIKPLIHQGKPNCKSKAIEVKSTPQGPWHGINPRKPSEGENIPQHLKGFVEFPNIEVYGKGNQQGETYTDDNF